MHCFKYTSAVSVCALLLLGSACARDESDGANAQRAHDAGATQDASAPSAQAGSRAKPGRSDAGLDVDDTDASAKDESKIDTQVRATGGSGGSKSSTTNRGGSGGAPARTTPPAGGVGGAGGAGGASGTTPTAGASGQASAAGTAGSTPTSEANGGTGGASADAGSGGESSESEGTAGEGSSEEGGENEGAGGAGGEGDSSSEEGGESEGSAGEGGETEGAGGAAGGSEEGGSTGEASGDCQRISTACAAVASPGADAMACLMVGESSDASACQARLADCRQACGAPLCQQLTADCPDNPADAPRQGCRNLGTTNDPNNCFDDGAECLTLCRTTTP